MNEPLLLNISKLAYSLKMMAIRYEESTGVRWEESIVSLGHTVGEVEEWIKRLPIESSQEADING